MDLDILERFIQFAVSNLATRLKGIDLSYFFQYHNIMEIEKKCILNKSSIMLHCVAKGP